MVIWFIQDPRGRRVHVSMAVTQGEVHFVTLGMLTRSGMLSLLSYIAFIVA